MNGKRKHRLDQYGGCVTGGKAVERDLLAVEGGDNPVVAEVRLCLWRVYGIATDFSDRPVELSWTSRAAAGPAPGDQLTITLGQVPNEVIESERAAKARGIFSIRANFLGEYSDMTDAAVEHALDDLYAETAAVEKEILDSYPLWLTFEVARPQRLRIDPTARYGWLQDPLIKPEWHHGYAKEASDFLDVAFARILPSLGDSLIPERLAFGQRRAYLLADGKVPLALPMAKLNVENMHLVTTGWNNLPFAAVAASLAALPTPSGTGDSMAAVSKWFHTAIGEREDPLRRFAFAFFGLEILANKFGKPAQGSSIAGSPAELDPPLDRRVGRTAECCAERQNTPASRFKALARCVAGAAATADTQEFQYLQKRRNELVHGRATDGDLAALPAERTINLLRRYMALVMSTSCAG